MPRTELVVLQPTPFCNIDCSYCYLPNRRAKGAVSVESLQSLFSQLFASGWVQRSLDVVWHAGEPLVLPVAFYRNALERIARVTPPDVYVAHAFQTNGTLLDDAWCDFFLEHCIGVGVSIDGPRHLHDRYRRSRARLGTFDRTVAGIRLLRSRGVPFHVISVLTAESLRAPDEMFAFYVAEGIEAVCFNVEESEGSHVSRSFATPDIEVEFDRFLRAFWKRACSEPDKMLFIREFEAALAQVLRPRNPPVANQLVEPFAIISMDWRGNISTFSPELLGLQSRAYADFLLGNINHDRLADMPAHPNLWRMWGDIAAGVEQCQETCPYFPVCGGGEPVNKLFENGTFASTETKFCRMTRMRTTDVVLDVLDNLLPAIAATEHRP